MLAILIAATVVVMMGLAVDVSGHVHAMQEARSVAREAARAGGQQVNVPTAIRGHGVQANPGEAAAAANTYLAAAGTDRVGDRDRPYHHRRHRDLDLPDPFLVGDRYLDPVIDRASRRAHHPSPGRS